MTSMTNPIVAVIVATIGPCLSQLNAVNASTPAAANTPAAAIGRPVIAMPSVRSQ